MARRFDAVIVGAGPAGSAAAILLARAGWNVALVERQRFPRRKVCGECIAATNLPLLDALGVGDAVRVLAGAELRRVALWRGDRSVAAALPAADDGVHRFGRALGREHLDTLLVERARCAGATVLQPYALHRFEGEPGRFTFQLRSAGEGGETIDLQAAVAIAAHGSWEPLPSERESRRAARKRSDLFAFKANFRGVRLDADLLPVLSFPGGYGGMVIADAGQATLACCVREDALERERSRPGERRAGDAVEAMLRRECGGVAESLRDARREGPWLSTGPIRPGVRLGVGDGVFRIGNAAGEAHPIIGEGISMALQSAFLLASMLGAQREALAGASALPAHARLLGEYEALWRASFAPRLRIAAMFAHAAMRPAVAASLWPLVLRWPGVLARGARWSGKTRCLAQASRLAEASR